MLDISAQSSIIETGSGFTTYLDPLTTTVEGPQRVKADSLSRSKANACFPEATGKRYDAFMEDIRKNGQLNPVLVHGHEVVDGWTRVRICIELGRPVLTLQVANADDKKPEDWVRATLSSQFSRQHFSKLQKAAIIREMVKAAGRGRPKKGSKIDSFLDDLAKEYQISKSYLKLVDRVQREPECEREGVLEDIRLGKMTASQVNARFKKPQPIKEPPPAPVVGLADGEPAALETAPDQAATVVDSSVDAASVVNPEAPEILKGFRRILGRLPEKEKSQFRDLIEPVCDFLEINLNGNRFT